MNFRPSARPDLTKLAVPNGSNEPRCTKRRYVDAFWRLARLALSLAFPVALVAGSPPIIVRSPPLQVSPATTERLVKLGAFRSGPILFKVGCKVVRGGIVKVSVEQSSGYSFLDREGADWVTKHWRFGVAATGTYHVPLVVGARTGRVTSQAIASAPHPVHLVPKLTWNALVQSHNGVAFNMRLLVRIEVRDGLVLSARVTRTSGVAIADSAVVEWIKSRWKFQKSVQGPHIFEFYIKVDPSPKQRGIVVDSKEWGLKGIKPAAKSAALQVNSRA